MKEFKDKLGTNCEPMDNGLMEHIVNKYWYKFSYGIFTDEQLEMFFEDLNNANLDFTEVVMAMIEKKKDTYLRRFDPMDK